MQYFVLASLCTNSLAKCALAQCVSQLAQNDCREEKKRFLPFGFFRRVNFGAVECVRAAHGMRVCESRQVQVKHFAFIVSKWQRKKSSVLFLSVSWRLEVSQG